MRLALYLFCDSHGLKMGSEKVFKLLDAIGTLKNDL